MDWWSWLGFALSLLVILTVSRKSLPAGLFFGTLVLAIFTLDVPGILAAAAETLSDPVVLALVVIVAVIPMVGGLLEDSGAMDSLVDNLRMGKKAFLALAPGILGMLPMPGGALLSAPLVQRVAPEVEPELKTAINVWFRHILYMVYPISTVLIATSAIAGISLYTAIGHMFPFFLFSIVIGYIFFLREVDGARRFKRRFSLKGLLIPLGIILTAPVVDIAFKRTFRLDVQELATLLGVAVALVFTVVYTKRWDVRFLRMVKKMKVWNYSLIILAMFFFVNVFTEGTVPALLGSLAIPDWAFMVSVGFLLGFATGRIQAPMFILIPIYLAKAGTASMNPWVFAVSYFSVFLGYAIAPAHPCVTVSIEYFGGDLRGVLKRMSIPVGICVAAAFLFAFFVFP